MGKLDELARGRLRTWRDAQGITQAELAKKIGRNAVWVSRYLDDAYDADLDTLKQLAEALGHTLFELLDTLPSEDEGDLIDAYRALPKTERPTAIRVLQLMTGAATPLRKRAKRA